MHNKINNLKTTAVNGCKTAVSYIINSPIFKVLLINI